MIARMPDFVTVVEVIGPGIVEIDGLLQEPEAEHIRVEVQVSARFSSHRCDVVDAK
jgi:hypothetical protein